MKIINITVLAAATAMTFVTPSPAESARYSNTQGYWGGSSGWGSSGWTSSGWGSSGWGNSRWASSGWHSPNYGGTTSGLTSTSSSTVGSSSSTSSNGTGGVSNDPPLGGTPVPEPSNLLMLGLGMVGLVAGRLIARRRKSKNS